MSLNWTPAGPFPGQLSLHGHYFRGNQATEYPDYDLVFCVWARADLAAEGFVVAASQYRRTAGGPERSGQR